MSWPTSTPEDARKRLEAWLDEHYYPGARDDLREVATPSQRLDAATVEREFRAWRRMQPSGVERFPYDIAKAAFSAGVALATEPHQHGGKAS